MAHVSEVKKQEVKGLIALIESHPVVGLVDVQGIKGRQLQKIRRDLRGTVTIRASRNTLLAIALKKSKKKLENLSPYLKGGASLICTTIDPFQLNMLLEEKRTSAPARSGDICPDDIVIPAGDTGFPPGPLVGELQRAGIPARIEKGSITVQKDHLFVKKGEIITARQAEILGKLGVEPMTVGLELLGICEDGNLFESSVLHIDREDFMSKINTAYQQALNVGIEACIITEDTITLLISKAARSATSLGAEACILTPALIPRLLAKGYAHYRIIESLITGEPVQPAAQEAPKSDKIEEKEEKKETEALEGLGSLFG